MGHTFLRSSKRVEGVHLVDDRLLFLLVIDELFLDVVVFQVLLAEEVDSPSPSKQLVVYLLEVHF